MCQCIIELMESRTYILFKLETFNPSRMHSTINLFTIDRVQIQNGTKLHSNLHFENMELILQVLLIDL